MEYDEMLDRAIAETPDVTEGDERLDLPDPEVREEGKVTVVENFRTLCGQLGREPGHLLQFLQAEVGTSGHIDESGRARLTGEFGERRISDALDAYVEEFVLCSECGLPDTHIVREQGAVLLQCDACGARSATSS